MSAIISSCTTYRYRLEREWSKGKRTVCFIMLNPSTADATVDDPTIRRCIGFGKSWGFDRLVVVNLFALRATMPSELRKYMDPIGPHNNGYIIKAVRSAELIACAWGAHPFARERAAFVRILLGSYSLYCLDMTKSGAPKHPLYATGGLQPSLWKPS